VKRRLSLKVVFIHLLEHLRYAVKYNVDRNIR